MATTRPPFPPAGNRLLARLPRADQDRLLPHLRAVPLEQDQVLYEARRRIDYAYFPVRGATSALTVMTDGDAIEVATVGNEGVVGQGAFFGVDISTNRMIVQIAGDALRMEVGLLKRDVGDHGPLRQLLVGYHTAFQAQVSQSVACNGLHTVQQRCCRWLLMTHDRVGADDIRLTHEYLAMMLGVRRPSVTEVLRPLQERGLLANHRRRITILDRKGLEAVCCECYRVVNEEYDRLLGPLPEA